jgi:hypothetical protein
MTGFWKGKRIRERAAPGGAGRYAALAALVLITAASGWAQEEAPPTLESLSESIGGVQTNANILWTLVAAALVLDLTARPPPPQGAPRTNEALPRTQGLRLVPKVSLRRPEDEEAAKLALRPQGRLLRRASKKANRSVEGVRTPRIAIHRRARKDQRAYSEEAARSAFHSLDTWRALSLFVRSNE